MTDLKKLRKDWLSAFVLLAFVFPISLAAFSAACFWLVDFVEANFSEHSSLIYGWSIWIGVCLATTFGFYRAEKRDLK